MIDYDFYLNTYLGSTIPEKAFPGVAARAVDGLNQLKRRYQLRGDTVSEKMALCAMAESIYAKKSRKDGVASATVGGVSVRYEDSGSMNRQLLRQARIYLDVYRGVAQ